MATLSINRSMELVSVTEAARHLAGLISRMKENLASKIFLTKNNTIEAVLLPIAEYEKLLDLQEDLDHFMLYQEIRQREAADSGKRISLAELDKKYGLEG